jgi:hypothetical protein
MNAMYDKGIIKEYLYLLVSLILVPAGALCEKSEFSCSYRAYTCIATYFFIKNHKEGYEIIS